MAKSRHERRKESQAEDSEPKTRQGRRGAPKSFALPTGRRTPVSAPWRYAYLITGEKKIGKTSFAINGCEEMVLQFDKPQLAYHIREKVIESWGDSMKAIAALEDLAKGGNFPYTRLVFDGVSEWYSMAQASTCKHFGIDHPSDEGFARAWHWLRDIFTDAINRVLRLQQSGPCGVVFIAHAEWKEVPIRSPWNEPKGATIPKIDKLVPNLSNRCEEIVGGKVDGWFCYDYDEEDRVLIVRGDQGVSAGHRIDGRFETPDGRPIREVFAGTSATETMENFIAAFRNEWKFATMDEYREANTEEQPRTRRGRKSRR